MSLSRWWQSLGFGIQSKTDYAFLKDVIKERLPYYGYADLWHLFPDAKYSEHRKAQLFFRVCNHFHDKNIVLAGEFSALELKACAMALGRTPIVKETRFSTNNLDAVIIKGIDADNSELWQVIQEKNAVTYDFVDYGIVIFYANRYPEHYKLI